MQIGSKVNPPEGYTVDGFRLNGGLDFISPKIDAPKGSLLDCLNREVVDRIGYRRIDGYERYDGSVNSFSQDYYYIEAASIYNLASVGDPLVVSGSDQVFGILVQLTGIGDIFRLSYALVNDSVLPTTGDIVAVAGSFDVIDTTTGPLSYVNDSGSDATELVTLFNSFATGLRGQVTYPGYASFANPNSAPAHGLHWFRDRLYAVADDYWIYFDSGGTTQPIANQFIGTTGTRARILSVQLESGTWAGGDAKGILQVDSAVTWADNTDLDTYTALTGGSVITTNILTVAAEADFTDVPVPLYGSLWQARSYQQLIDEGVFGTDLKWSRIDHGWEADFTDGVSETGGFTIVSRGTENNFVFDSDSIDTFPFQIFNGTNLVGTAFAPGSINAATTETVSGGYSGWKTNASVSVFADSDALKSATDTDDTNYAYANIWYYGEGDTPSGFGLDPGELGAFDKSIYGPVATFNNRTAPTVTGAGTFDTDFFNTQARAPLVLNDFSDAAVLIPAGALIQGVEVVVDYDSQHYAEGVFAADRNGVNGADIIANTITWVDNNLSLGAQFCRSSSTSEAEALGEASYAPVLIQTTPASYNDDITNTTDTDTFKMEATLTTQTSTIGSSSSTLGFDSIARADLFDSSFGLALFGQVTAAPLYPLSPAMTSVTPSGFENVLGIVRLRIDKITVRFHYTVPSARYYVGDGGAAPAKVCSVDMVYYVQRDGSFASSSASGLIQYTDLAPITNASGTKRTVESGDKFYLTQADAEASSNPVLTVSSDADYNGIPSLQAILATKSRYEFITANFFGREDWDGFYGVSGAGRAFSFATYDADNDGTLEKYVVNITTNTNDEEGDIPRHIAYHHNALALGYKSGIVRFSALGEPENFDGVDGASEIGVGDEVTGLLSMQGTTLGVFCENSIWGIQGTDVDNYQSTVLAPYTGALEYTVVDMGIPVYCDSRGISTLEQSAKYGNFQGQRLSKEITPWIVPRMIRNTAQFSGKGAVCAIPVRSKNQYRVFFKDGKVLSMTITPEQSPAFTFSEYTLNDTVNKAVPVAWSSQVDDTGVERIHFTSYTQDYFPLYVYELDRGWGFDGYAIPASYTVNWYYKDPFSDSTIKKVRLDGLSQGFSTCAITLAKDYNLQFNTVGTDISIPKSKVGEFTIDLVPVTNMANVAATGRNLSLKVTDTLLDIGPTPPDIHQMMLVQFDPGGKIDA